MNPLDNLVAISVVAVVLALFLRSRGIGIALPLFGFGLVIGFLPFGPRAPEDPELIQALVLAPLVFGEALGSSYVDIKSVRKPVLWLAVGLVVISTGLIGALTIALVAGIPVAMAFALGAILAPTDAVAVAAAARRANLPRRVVTILEGESLLNDGTGLTALRVAVVAAVAGTITWWGAGAILAQSVLVGLAVGAAAGYLLVQVVRHSSDTVAFGGLLLVAPLPIYLVAESFDGSAILAIVVAALMVSHASHSDPSYRGRLQVATVWRQITLVLQAIAFLLLGLELPSVIASLPADQAQLLWTFVPAVVVAVIVIRMVLVWVAVGVSHLVGGTPQGRWRNATLIGWAGTRGPVSALAAFSLPLLTAEGAVLPYRDFVIAVAFCAIAATLLLSTTIAPMAKWLKLEQDDPVQTQSRVRAAVSRAALSALGSAADRADRDGTPIPPVMLQALRIAAEERIEAAEAQVPSTDNTTLAQSLMMTMLEAEQQELQRLRFEEGLPDAVARSMLTDIDRRMSLLRQAPPAH
jgi:monovalent cation/hydrogen antiporter